MTSYTDPRSFFLLKKGSVTCRKITRAFDTGEKRRTNNH